MNKCNKIEQMVINGTAETDIAFEISSELEEHIASCESCRDFAKSMRYVINMLKHTEKLTVSDSFDQQLQLKLDKHRKQTSIARKPNVSVLTRVTYYIAGIVAVLLGFFYISNTGVIDDKGLDLQPNSNIVNVVDEKPVIQEDSLKNLKENIINDEDLRNTVSTDDQ